MSKMGVESTVAVLLLRTIIIIVAVFSHGKCSIKSTEIFIQCVLQTSCQQNCPVIPNNFSNSAFRRALSHYIELKKISTKHLIKSDFYKFYTDNKQRNIDNECGDVVLDLSKAFAKVCHEGLIFKLKNSVSDYMIKL